MDEVFKCLAKRFLIEIEKARIAGVKVNAARLSDELGLSTDLVNGLVSRLKREGLITLRKETLLLTNEGRKQLKVAVTGGVFDIVHLGHLKTLMEAKKRCDLLVVIIARDETVLKTKSKRPVNNEEKRLKIVESLKPVDIAILGDIKDFNKPLSKINPDLIILGHDQELPPQLGKLMNKYVVERLNVHVDGESTTNILNRIRNVLRKEDFKSD